MQINNATIHSANFPMFPLHGEDSSATLNELNSKSKGDSPELREAFDNFVGETFYGQMLKSLRSTVGKSAYFHGGRAEEVFQGQLDQVLAEEMSKANANEFTDSMYHLFTLRRA